MATPGTQSKVTAEQLSELSERLDENLAVSVGQIRDINEDINVLAINAKIEAARAGQAGRGFVVVADNIRRLVSRTDDIMQQMNTQVSDLVRELSVMSSRLALEVRGQYFSQAAFNAIDIVDRNLYERSCDVRWWAADPPLLDALTSDQPELTELASRRLSQILDSYTVYFDLVLVDSAGRVRANGRPNLYNSRGSSAQAQDWFKRALKLRSGDEYVVQGAHSSELVKNETVLAYACAIHHEAGGGELCGVLGILFRWQDLGRTAVHHAVDGIESTGVAEGALEAMIVTSQAEIIAATKNEYLGTMLDQSSMQLMIENEMGYGTVEVKNKRYLVGCAHSPGYEGYNSGWYCLVRQEIA